MDDEESPETRPKFGECVHVQLSICQTTKTNSNDHRLLETGRFSDFTITCTDRTFKVHKAILYARSSYFRDLLTSDFKVTYT